MQATTPEKPVSRSTPHNVLKTVPPRIASMYVTMKIITPCATASS